MDNITPSQVRENKELIQNLFKTANKAAEHAFAPFSNFHVGAALLDVQGQIFTGCNVENSSYGATICAERTALVKAVSEGSRDFAAIAVVSQDGEAWPCGICRQVLFEFSPQMLVITGNEEHLDVVPLEELLPHGFRLDK